MLVALLVLTLGQDAAARVALPAPLAIAADPEATAPPDASPGTLGLAELQELALRRNPTIAQAVARIEQAQGRARQAGVYPNPLLIWSAASLGDEGTVGTQQGFIQQPIVTGGKLRVNRARYGVDVEVARWNVAMQREFIRNGVHLRYLQLLAQQRILDLRAGLVRLADETVQTARAKAGDGDEDQADVLTAELEAEQLRLDLDQLHARYLSTWSELAAYLGCPEMAPARLDGTLEGDVPHREWEVELARLLAESPELRVAELRVRRVELTLDRERRETIPDLVVRGGAGHDPTSGQTTGYTQVYLDLPIWDRNRGNVQTAMSGLVEARLDVERVRLSLQQRLARAYNHYRTSELNVLRHREEILPRAARALALYRRSYESGGAGYSRVQSLQSAYARAYVKYVEELLELRSAAVALDGLLLYEGSIEVGTLRPSGSGGLAPPGQGLPNQSPGGGIPVGRPTRQESP